MAFNEDYCRVRKNHGPQNFVILRHVALNGVRLQTQLKQEKSAKRGIKGKRLLAAWNEDYLLKVLTGVPGWAIKMRLPCYRGLKDFDNALAYGLESVQLSLQLGEPRTECDYSISVGVVYLAHQDMPNALTFLETSRKLAQKLGFRREEAEVLQHLVGIHFQQNEAALALAHLHRDLTLAREIEAR